MVKKAMNFYLVDVFCSEKYSGNQLAVVLVDEILTDSQMQKIAHEFNFSETTFVSRKECSENEYAVRIFTPQNVPSLLNAK